MSRHPAPEELLLDYAAGALAAGPALAVALHVALDPAARRTVERLGALGGALMEGEGDSRSTRPCCRARWRGWTAFPSSPGRSPTCRGRASNGRRRRSRPISGRS